MPRCQLKQKRIQNRVTLPQAKQSAVAGSRKIVIKNKLLNFHEADIKVNWTHALKRKLLYYKWGATIQWWWGFPHNTRVSCPRSSSSSLEITHKPGNQPQHYWAKRKAIYLVSKTEFHWHGHNYLSQSIDCGYTRTIFASWVNREKYFPDRCWVIWHLLYTWWKMFIRHPIRTGRHFRDMCLSGAPGFRSNCHLSG